MFVTHCFLKCWVFPFFKKRIRKPIPQQKPATTELAVFGHHIRRLFEVAITHITTGVR